MLAAEDRLARRCAQIAIHPVVIRMKLRYLSCLQISNTDILQSIASCLADMHDGLTFTDEQVNLSGIIYIHPINELRMTGSANLTMFWYLIGEENLKNCVLDPSFDTKMCSS